MPYRLQYDDGEFVLVEVDDVKIISSVLECPQCRQNRSYFSVGADCLVCANCGFYKSREEWVALLDYLKSI
jgi:ribosomal protein L32